MGFFQFFLDFFIISNLMVCLHIITLPKGPVEVPWSNINKMKRQRLIKHIFFYIDT